MLHNNYHFCHYNSLAQPNWEVALLKMICKLTPPSCKANVNLDYPYGTLFTGYWFSHFVVSVHCRYMPLLKKSVFITPLEVSFHFLFIYFIKFSPGM